MTLVRTALFATTLGATVLLAGCQKPPVTSLGQAVTLGTVTATVTSIDMAYVDLEGPTGAALTAEPVLRIGLQVQNAGAEAVRYDLGWGTTTATQAQTALLFVDPGEEIVLSPSANIPVLQLSGWQYLDDPVTEATRVDPGQALTDVLVFQPPPADATSLLLSLPPALFGAENKLPVYVRIPYARQADPPRPQPVAMGEVAQGRGFTMRVDSVEQNFVRLTNAASQAGFSVTPLLRVNFTIQNTSDATIEYVPERANRSIDPPALIDPSGAPLERANFDDGVSADGMVNERRQIGVGESLTGYLLFKRPDPSTTALQLTFPGRRVGSSGLIRIDIPYAHVATIPDPPEMTPEPVQAPAPTPTPPQ